MKITFDQFIGRRPQTTDPKAQATLERLREDAKWRAFDEPAVYRRANVARLRIDRARRSV